MGLFDKFKATQNEDPLGISNYQEAWVGILLAVAKIDGQLSDMEINSVTPPIVRKTLFLGFDFNTSAQKILNLLNVSGSKKMIDMCVGLLPEDHKPTLYANCIEVAISDGDLSIQEQEIVEYLQKAMQLDLETASKIIEVIMIKSKWDSKITV